VLLVVIGVSQYGGDHVTPSGGTAPQPVEAPSNAG